MAETKTMNGNLSICSIKNKGLITAPFYNLQFINKISHICSHLFDRIKEKRK